MVLLVGAALGLAVPWGFGAMVDVALDGRGYPDVDPEATERFWAEQGWDRHPVEIAWTFDSRADFEAVVRIEFDRATADAVIAEHPTLPDGGVEVDYAVDLWSLTR